MNRKIYFLINSLEGGGAERVTTNLTHTLSEDNDITIITLKNKVFYDLPEGVRHLPLSKTTSNIIMFLLLPRYIIRFRYIIKSNQFDTGLSLLELSNFVHILSKKNAIISFRITVSAFRGLKGRLYRTLIKQLYPKAAKIIVNSEQNRYLLSEYLDYDIEKIEVLYNPINTEHVTRLKEVPLDSSFLQTIDNKTVFITVARLVRHKHHEKIIKAMSMIEKEDWIYIIIGDGPTRSALESLVKSYHLEDHIIFLGQQLNVFKYLDKADYFVYASAYEGFPNVLIEAMACDLPIITSDFISGAQEVIFGDYDKSRELLYPAYGPNGVLLDLENYEKNRLQVVLNLSRIKQERKGFCRFIIPAQIEDIVV